MKTKTITIALVQIAIVLCSVFLVATPTIAAEQTMQKVSISSITTASEDDYVLGIYGNANEDETIDMGDVVYTKLAIFGKKSKTELCDAKYDGRINVLDVIQTKLIILGKEKEITIIDVDDRPTFKNEDPIPGRVVTIKKPVKRIVVMHPAEAEVLQALDAVDKVVGVTKQVQNEKVLMPKLSELPAVSGAFTPDYEAVLDLPTDLLLTYLACDIDKMEEKLPGVNVVFLGIRNPISYAEGVRKLGYIIDKEEEAEQLINWREGWINKIKSRTEGLSEDEKPRVFIWYSYSLGKRYHSCNKHSRYNDMCVMAGGRNIAADLPSGTVDPEWVVVQNPDIILASANPFGYNVDDPSEMAALREDIMNRPELANVNAVKTGKVYMIASIPLGIITAGQLVAIAYQAKWFQPDLFEDLDPRAIHQEYLDRFHKDLNFNVYEHGVWVYPPLED